MADLALLALALVAFVGGAAVITELVHAALDLGQMADEALEELEG